ncbi:calcium-activated potassium channel slowpoke, partial [Caerostris extrusa]
KIIVTEQVHEADACLVLANKYCQDPDAEDAANIMRVISIKNYSDEIRVIIQLMQYHNKTHKMHILNIDSTHSFQAPDMPNWQNDYLCGTGMEMYTENLSPSFGGMTFPQAAVALFKKGVRAVQVVGRANESVHNSTFPTFTPPEIPKRVKLRVSNIAGQVGGRHNATYHGSQGTTVAHGTTARQRNSTSGLKPQRAPGANPATPLLTSPATKNGVGQPTANPGLFPRPTSRAAGTNGSNKQEGPLAVGLADDQAKDFDFEKTEMKYDSTGMFHWCPAKSLEDCILDRNQAAMTVLNGHVVVCLFADPDSPLIGLRNLVMPLRASNFHYHELKTCCHRWQR